MRLSEDAFLKYRAAEELGLTDKLLAVGWGGLSAGETGKVGSLVRQWKMQRKEP